MSDEIDRLLKRACEIGATKLPPDTAGKICACGWVYPSHIQADLVVQEVPRQQIGVMIRITCPRCGNIVRVS
jgi:hypothetical protein